MIKSVNVHSFTNKKTSDRSVTKLMTNNNNNKIIIVIIIIIIIILIIIITIIIINIYYYYYYYYYLLLLLLLLLLNYYYCTYDVYLICLLLFFFNFGIITSKFYKLKWEDSPKISPIDFPNCHLEYTFPFKSQYPLKPFSSPFRLRSSHFVIFTHSCMPPLAS